jgi:hypothetical protein
MAKSKTNSAYRACAKHRFALRMAAIDPTIPISHITKPEASGNAAR